MTHFRAIPSFEGELARLRPVLPLIAEAIEFGAAQAQNYFWNRGAPVDPDLAPDILRYEAKQFLVERSGLIDGLVVEDLGNNGLSVRYAGGRVRIWKGEPESLPLPGTSFTKLAFLNQQLAFEGLLDTALPAVQPNVMIMWSVDREYRLLGLYLSMPAQATRDPQNTWAYWTEPIPPDDLIASPPPVAPPPDDDLPFERRETEHDDEAQAE